MLFNSIAFALFLPVAFFVFWMRRNQTLNRQNLIVIISGCIFYGWWDIRFLGLLILTSGIDFAVAILISRSATERRKRILLLISLLSNLSVLGFFKYFNFFADSFIHLAGHFGWKADYATLNIVLPVGISFYTFQALSYTIDVYKGKTVAVKSASTYFAYITFFPQLVAGPIGRSEHLIPQFLRIRKFTYDNGVAGLRLMLLGYLKKCVVADNVSSIADSAFSNSESLAVSSAIIGALAFSIQIYFDFSGYSDIARGCAKLFGIDLMVNFKRPYFAKSITEFWQRWHISMSQWFRDYVYIPLGGNQESNFKTTRNLLITFLVSGLWHGAAWTFVLWGLLHGTAIFIERQFRLGIKVNVVFKWAITMFIVVNAWVLFRAESFLQLRQYYSNIFGSGGHVIPADLLTGNWSSVLFATLVTGICLLIFTYEYLEERDKVQPDQTPKWIRISYYYVAITAILFLGVYQSPPSFIYFQF